MFVDQDAVRSQVEVLAACEGNVSHVGELRSDALHHHGSFRHNITVVSFESVWFCCGELTMLIVQFLLPIQILDINSVFRFFSFII